MAAFMWRRAFPLLRRVSRFSLHNSCQSTRRLYSAGDTNTEKQLEVRKATYPLIIPPVYAKTAEAEEYRKKLIIQRINDKPTATEMIHELSKVQNWHYTIHPSCFHYSFLDFYKHIVKTLMVENLPKQTMELAGTPVVEQSMEMLKPHIIDCILQEQLYLYRHKGKLAKQENVAGKQTMENIMRILLTGLAGDYPHLRDSQIDQDVQVQSFWKREETRFQFTGNPLFLIRTKDPLPEFISKEDELSVGEVPLWSYAPENVSVFKQHINPVCFPGFKTGNPFTYGHTQIYTSTFSRTRCAKDQILEEVLQGFGMSSSFGWLNGLALYQMNNPYRDLKHPMTCQTIVTNGCQFSFFCYQLNTMGLSSQSADNPLRNVCWYSPDMKLYGDIQDGRIIDFNNDVLKLVIAFLLNRTCPLEE
ncbi:28S ribosomal protein S30, mitochondrial-like isoform X1 [Acanthaster planci]|uniref:28S ribosomal protein S30, mitochondrial-like isoform X1 n=1 Tax=Acanthaster planci TaxID=133434 RepID=A0A8B7Z5D9_ACAPL|nr:28S ribosomal protein S30, mitochondrial-like isoform X1 [Acanthaster planci]